MPVAPHSDEMDGAVQNAERAVLAAMMLGPKGVDDARRLLTPETFHRDAHRMMFKAIVALDERGERADLVTVAAELGRRGDLELVGGVAFVSGVFELVTTTANVEVHARIVRTAAARRRYAHLGLKLTHSGEDATLDPAQMWAGIEAEGAALAASLNGAGSGGRFADAAVAAPALVAHDIPRPRSLLGDGALAAGGFAILYGKPGVGKSWLALSLTRSLVRGEPWMGLATPRDGARVGVLQLELPAHTLQARFRALGCGQHERDANLSIVCRPNLRGVVDLFRQAADVAALADWIRCARLDVLIVDALSRAHTASENKAEELGPVLAALDALRHETGCAIVLVHHEPKMRGEADADNDLDALRGSSRLQSDPTLLVRVRQSRGLRSLRFAKVSEAATPEDIYFALGADGCPVVANSPESASDATRGKVLRIVLSAPQPVSRGDIVAASGLSSATTKRHLEALGEAGHIERTGENKATRYSAPTGSPAQPAHLRSRAGELPLNSNNLNGWEPVTGSRTPDEDREGTGSPAQPALPTGERAGEPVSRNRPSGPAADGEPVAADDAANGRDPEGGNDD
jgi:replicative DNA helicase